MSMGISGLVVRAGLLSAIYPKLSEENLKNISTTVDPKVRTMLYEYYNQNESKVYSSSSSFQAFVKKYGPYDLPEEFQRQVWNKIGNKKTQAKVDAIMREYVPDVDGSMAVIREKVSARNAQILEKYPNVTPGNMSIITHVARDRDTNLIMHKRLDELLSLSNDYPSFKVGDLYALENVESKDERDLVAHIAKQYNESPHDIVEAINKLYTGGKYEVLSDNISPGEKMQFTGTFNPALFFAYLPWEKKMLLRYITGDTRGFKSPIEPLFGNLKANYIGTRRCRDLIRHYPMTSTTAETLRVVTKIVTSFNIDGEVLSPMDRLNMVVTMVPDNTTAVKKCIRSNVLYTAGSDYVAADLPTTTEISITDTKLVYRVYKSDSKVLAMLQMQKSIVPRRVYTQWFVEQANTFRASVTDFQITNTNVYTPNPIRYVVVCKMRAPELLSIGAIPAETLQYKGGSVENFLLPSDGSTGQLTTPPMDKTHVFTPVTFTKGGNLEAYTSFQNFCKLYSSYDGSKFPLSYGSWLETFPCFCFAVDYVEGESYLLKGVGKQYQLVKYATKCSSFLICVRY